MRELARRGLLGLVWLSVVGAVVGFFLPWASLDVKYRQVTDQVNQLAEGTPFQDLAEQLKQKVGRLVIHVKHGAETIAGELPDLSTIPTQVSGVQIPQLANRQDIQVVMALTEMLTGQRELGAKSYAVYLVPGLACLAALMVTLLRWVRLVCLLVGLLCCAVAAGGFWKLLTTETDTLLVAITIERGLWLSLWAYVGLGLAAVLLALLAFPRSTN
jgi:hypothetical protein